MAQNYCNFIQPILKLYKIRSKNLMLRTFKVIFILFHAFLLVKNSTVTPAQDYNPYIVARNSFNMQISVKLQ